MELENSTRLKKKNSEIGVTILVFRIVEQSFPRLFLTVLRMFYVLLIKNNEIDDL